METTLETPATPTATPETDLAAHYKAVRARIAAKAAAHTKALAKPAAQDPAPATTARPLGRPAAAGRKPVAVMKVPLVVLVTPTANALNPDVPVVERPHKRIRAVVEPILRSYETPWEELIGPSRKRHLIPVRLAVYAALHNAGLTLAQIGRFCRRDHTTILHYLTKWAGYRRTPRVNPYKVTFK